MVENAIEEEDVIDVRHDNLYKSTVKFVNPQ